MPNRPQESQGDEEQPNLPENLQAQYVALCRKLPIDCGEFIISNIICATSGIPERHLFPRFGLCITMPDGSSGGTVMLEFGLEGIEKIYFLYTPMKSIKNDEEVIGKVRAYFSTQASIPLTCEMYTLANDITKHKLG